MTTLFPSKGMGRRDDAAVSVERNGPSWRRHFGEKKEP